MTGDDGIGGRAYATRMAQLLAGPAEVIVAYQELLVEEVREHGPTDALDDVLKVLEAARGLARQVGGLITGAIASPEGDEAEARLRHDLRTPINAILGYSEMVAEEFADELAPHIASDIETVIAEARRLQGVIDAIVEHAAGDEAALPDEADVTLAADLARSIASEPGEVGTMTGRILVVDDNETNRELLARRLGRDGHTVEKAHSAAEALDILARGGIDVALLDILMPDMNGFELLRRMKSDPALREVPVLMVSGLKEDSTVLRCIAAGAEDYLPKPVDPVLLRARLDACLERRRWRAREQRYMAKIKAEKERADALLHAILPIEVVQRLEAGEALIADRFDQATIIFADIVDFTSLAARIAPSALLRRLGVLFGRFDDLAEQHGIEKIKTIGDAYMAAAGVPRPREDHAQAAIGFARALIAEMAKSDNGGPPLRVRVGIHSGPVVAGLIGRKRFVYDIWGHTVNVASRLEANSTPGRIQISQSTLDAFGQNLPVDPQGEIDMKGVGAVSTFLLAD